MRGYESRGEEKRGEERRGGVDDRDSEQWSVDSWQKAYLHLSDQWL